MGNNILPAKFANSVLEDLKLQERLTRAMAKAGVTADVALTKETVHQDYYDISGICVKATDPAVRDRAIAWVRAALKAAGVKQWHTGAWQGPCVMGDPEVLSTKVYGVPVTMVTLLTISIGD